MAKNIPNDIINMIMKYVGPTPTAKIMKNAYIGYEPEYITIDDEEIEFNKIKSSSEICDEINHISIYDCKYLTIDDYEIDFKKINLNSET